MPLELRQWHTGRKGKHNVRGRPENYTTTEHFRPRKREDVSQYNVTQRYAALDAGLGSDSPSLKGREWSEIFESGYDPIRKKRVICEDLEL